MTPSQEATLTAACPRAAAASLACECYLWRRRQGLLPTRAQELALERWEALAADQCGVLLLFRTEPSG